MQVARHSNERSCAREPTKQSRCSRNSLPDRLVLPEFCDVRSRTSTPCARAVSKRHARWRNATMKVQWRPVLAHAGLRPLARATASRQTHYAAPDLVRASQFFRRRTAGIEAVEPRTALRIRQRTRSVARHRVSMFSRINSSLGSSCGCRLVCCSACLRLVSLGRGSLWQAAACSKPSAVGSVSTAT